MVTEATGTLLIEEADEFGNVLSPSSTQLSDTLDSLTVSYTYDLFNRLLETKTGKKTVSFTYEADGYRHSKSAVTPSFEENIVYFYEGDHVAFEEDEAGKVTAVNHCGTNRYARTIYEGEEETTFYYQFNAYGDVTALIGTDGSTIAKYEYDAFGNLTSQPDVKVNNSITYRGSEYDAETGLYYLNARYYDSETARFLTEDTYRGEKNDPLSLNLYTYCKNNPLKYTDPTGHMNYFKQSDNLLIGIFGAISDDLKGIIQSPKAIYELVQSLVNGEVTPKDLILAGLDGLAEEINYYKDHAYIISPFSEASDEEVEEFGKHIGVFISDALLAYAGGKLLSGLTKVFKGTKLGKALISKADDIALTLKGADKTDDIARAADKVSDTGKAVKKANETAKDVLDNGISNKPEQLHHFASNKNKTYTPQFKEIADKYGLDLNDSWNKKYMPHQGRHANEYHEFVLEKMKQFDIVAQGNKNKFLKLYDKMKTVITENPDMLYKKYWKKGGH